MQKSTCALNLVCDLVVRDQASTDFFVALSLMHKLGRKKDAVNKLENWYSYGKCTDLMFSSTLRYINFFIQIGVSHNFRIYFTKNLV